MRNQPKEHTEKSKPTHTHEKSNLRTDREIKTQTTIQNYINQIAQISPQTQDL